MDEDRRPGAWTVSMRRRIGVGATPFSGIVTLVRPNCSRLAFGREQFCLHRSGEGAVGGVRETYR